MYTSVYQSRSSTVYVWASATFDAFRLTSEGVPLSADGHDRSAAFAQPRGSTP